MTQPVPAINRGPAQVANPPFPSPQISPSRFALFGRSWIASWFWPAILLGLLSIAGAVHAAQPASDFTIQSEIQQRLARSVIGHDGFTARVKDGVVYWEGSTSVAQHKGAATRMAKSAGARRVVNNIHVTGTGSGVGAAKAAARKSAGETAGKAKENAGEKSSKTSEKPVPGAEAPAKAPAKPSPSPAAAGQAQARPIPASGDAQTAPAQANLAANATSGAGSASAPAHASAAEEPKQRVHVEWRPARQP